mmetsp:Transcript_54723/g.152723  ORF Transcript_54723/g.152723 Transcript_54723/m.152723 type:complete len:284 (-) Transcript_54723:567-1418(-)
MVHPHHGVELQLEEVCVPRNGRLRNLLDSPHLSCRFALRPEDRTEGALTDCFLLGILLEDVSIPVGHPPGAGSPWHVRRFVLLHVPNLKLPVGFAQHVYFAAVGADEHDAILEEGCQLESHFVSRSKAFPDHRRTRQARQLHSALSPVAGRRDKDRAILWHAASFLVHIIERPPVGVAVRRELAERPREGIGAHVLPRQLPCQVSAVRSDDVFKKHGQLAVGCDCHQRSSTRHLANEVQTRLGAVLPHVAANPILVCPGAGGPTNKARDIGLGARHKVRDFLY